VRIDTGDVSQTESELCTLRLVAENRAEECPRERLEQARDLAEAEQQHREFAWRLDRDV
jgi:hypothetical protein